MQRGNKSAEKIADYKGIKEIMGKINLLKKITGYRGVKKRAGFSLIEVIIAIAILLIIVVSVLMLATVSAASLKDSEARDMAKNIATYTVEYLRSRNVTHPDNPMGHVYPDEFIDATHPNRYFPGLEDLGTNPLLTNPMPLKPNSSSDTINIHPALPSDSYNTTSFYSSLQGYVSLADSPTDSTPSLEDGNAKVVSGKYYDLTTGAPYVVRFPNGINNFTALAGYNAKIYTTDSGDPHYTNTDKDKCMAYRGFRVLTQIAARAKEDPTNPGHPYPHVQYYDVKVTVFWTIGSYEHSYNLATQIITYGGS
jgi:prepilin-type N-terminal cleavage/methylation domain-containing protein